MVRWKGLALGALLVGMIFDAANAATYDWENCYPNGRKAEFPGLAVGATYDRVRKILPRVCQGREAKLHGCTFIDKHGYEVSFMGDDGPVGGGSFLIEKVASASRRPPLPLGISWSDGLVAVERKLKAAGYRTFKSPTMVGVDACLLSSEAEAYHFMLWFDAKGRMVEARQFFDAS